MSAYEQNMMHWRHLLTPAIRDIQVLKTYGAAPYAAGLKRLEKQIKEKQTSVNEKIGPAPPLQFSTHRTKADNDYRSQGTLVIEAAES